MEKIILTVSNDLVIDQRVNRIATSLTEAGYDILIVGRQLRHSNKLTQKPYAQKRLRLKFNKGALFYATLNLRLFFFLLFRKCDALVANDLDTLLPVFLVSKLRRKVLIYDSHELFPEVPELVNRPRIKHFWERLEKYLVPKVKYCYTVCQSIADFYFEKYHTVFEVIKNVPLLNKTFVSGDGPDIQIDKPYILYQGAVNLGRGLELAIEAMQFTQKLHLVIAGDGDVKSELEELAKSRNLHNVTFTGRIPFEQLSRITGNASFGISIEENIGLNYYYALPNKLFDYIAAEIPVIVSDLPEMSKIVKDYEIGIVLEERNPKALADLFEHVAFSDERRVWKNNLEKAKSDLNWEKESVKLKKLYKSWLG